VRIPGRLAFSKTWEHQSMREAFSESIEIDSHKIDSLDIDR